MIEHDLLFHDWPTPALVDHEFPEATTFGHVTNHLMGIGWNIHWIAMGCIIKKMRMFGWLRGYKW